MSLRECIKAGTGRFDEHLLITLARKVFFLLYLILFYNIFNFGQLLEHLNVLFCHVL